MNNKCFFLLRNAFYYYKKIFSGTDHRFNFIFPHLVLCI